MLNMTHYCYTYIDDINGVNTDKLYTNSSVTLRWKFA